MDTFFIFYFWIKTELSFMKKILGGEKPASKRSQALENDLNQI